jgi:hypothetical protein
VTDNAHTPVDDRAAPPPRADANDAEAYVGTPPAQPAAGALREEGTPGLGAITLGALLDAAAGETIALGRPGTNNHSLSVGADASDLGQASRVSIVWIESPAGDTSGIGAVMLQRLSADPGKTVAWATLASAANDNATQVTELSGAGAIGSSPAVAELTTGHTLIAWIGADSHAHGRLYPPARAKGAADGPGYTKIDAALDDLGPVGETSDGARRLQVAELRAGTFAVMWLALAQGDPVLRGSLFVGPAGADHDSNGPGWTQHAIPDVHLPQRFPGPFSIAFAAGGAEARLEVTCSDPPCTITFTPLDRDSVDSAETTIVAAALDTRAGPSAVGSAGEHAGAPPAPDESSAAYLDAPPDASGASAAQSARRDMPAEIVLTVAATPGEDETAPLVETMRDGFAVGWLEPGATDQARQIKVVLYDANGDPRGPEILVADNAAGGVEATEISALEDGLAAAYVDAGSGALVVKAYTGDGVQIGQEAIVALGGAGAIIETALAANAANELAVVYRQQDGNADDGAVDYGSIMLQRYSIATVGGVAALVEVGSDGEGNDPDWAVQAVDAGGDTSPLELGTGRAPAAIGLDTGFAIAWVESDGTRDVVRGVILDRHGAQVQRIDLSQLHADAGIAEGTEPTLLDVGDGSFLASWLQPDANGGYVVMTAVYRETTPGVWLEPDAAIALKAFSSMPDDYAVSVSFGAEWPVINVVWDEGNREPGGHEAVYNQRYSLDGLQLGDATKIAPGDTAAGEPQREVDSLAAAGLANGQVVVLARQGSEGDRGLFAHVVATPPHAADDDGGSSDATDAVSSRTFTTRVGEETAINPLAEGLGSGPGISHINGLPITTASPVDVGFGWVQLREDGWLTVTPDAGYRGRIAFDYAVAGMADGQDASGHVDVDVGADTAPAAVMLRNQVTAVAEDVSMASALKVADIAMTDGGLGTDGLSLTGLDAGIFEIVGDALYLKQGIELDFETRPTLSVEIVATHTGGHDSGASFTLNVAGAGAAALAAANDMLVFAPGYGEAIVDHPLIDLASIRYATFQELMDAGALTQEGDNVVITLNPDDHADLQKIVLKAAALAALGDADFKFS